MRRRAHSHAVKAPAFCGICRPCHIHKSVRGPAGLTSLSGHSHHVQGAIHRIVAAANRGGTTDLQRGVVHCVGLAELRAKMLPAVGSSMAHACYSSDHSQMAHGSMSHQFRRSYAPLPSTCPAHACTLQGTIHRIVLALGDREGTTACSDGSCILWDLETFKRRRILAAGSSIADACYSLDQSQLITAGMSHQSRPGPVLCLHACICGSLKQAGHAAHQNRSIGVPSHSIVQWQLQS